MFSDPEKRMNDLKQQIILSGLLAELKRLKYGKKPSKRQPQHVLDEVDSLYKAAFDMLEKSGIRIREPIEEPPASPAWPNFTDTDGSSGRLYINRRILDDVTAAQAEHPGDPRPLWADIDMPNKDGIHPPLREPAATAVVSEQPAPAIEPAASPETQRCLQCDEGFTVTSDTGFHCENCASPPPDVIRIGVNDLVDVPANPPAPTASHTPGLRATRSWTVDQLQTLISMKTAKRTDKEIGERLGKSTGNCSVKWSELKKKGIVNAANKPAVPATKAEPEPVTESRGDQVIRMWEEENLSIEKIADRLGCSVNYVRGIITVEFGVDHEGEAIEPEAARKAKWDFRGENVTAKD